MVNNEKQQSNPYSTGGGGVIFETRVQAYFTILMLLGGFAPCIPNYPITKIKLQGRYDGYNTDDLIIFSTDPKTGEQAKLLAQIKHEISITERDETFSSVIQSNWNDFKDTSFNYKTDAIALITGLLSATDINNVLPILEWSRTSENENEFFIKINTEGFSSKSKREKLEVFRNQLKKANNEIELSNQELWRFLKAFYIIGYDLDLESGLMLSQILSQIEIFSNKPALDLWSRVVDFVQTVNQNAGTITVKNLPTDIKNTINFSKENTITGDRIYPKCDNEYKEALVKSTQETSSIYQNTQDGDIAARDIDKRVIYNNCTIIQLFDKDSNFNDPSLESLKEFDFTGIDQEIIQKAYQDVLPPDANLWILEKTDIKQILHQLSEFRRLFDFLNKLSLCQNIPKDTRDKLSVLAKEIASKKQEENINKLSTVFFPDQGEQLESYLIFTLTRCDDDNNKFLINAWLIIDDSIPVKDLSKFISLLDKNAKQPGIFCKFNDIQKQLDKFINTSVRYLRGKRYQLIIEIFLPIDLIDIEIDQWKIYDPVVEQITIGVKYPIRLRLLERLGYDYLDYYLSDWCKYWDKVKTVLDNEPVQELFLHLQEMENFNCKSLTKDLKEKIGLKVTCAPTKDKTKELFRAILAATTPIAIWTRYDIPNFDHVAAINEMLAFKPLCHLCESVRQTREQADAQTKEHFGSHLALLWEDPYHLPPDIMLELTMPGQ